MKEDRMNPQITEDSTDISVEAIVDELRNNLASPQATFAAALSAVQGGKTLGETVGLTPEHYAALYDIACELQEAGDVERATVVALNLALHEPRDSKYTLMAAQCLQSQGLFEQAIGLHTMSLMHEPSPEVLMRLAECWICLGEDDHAAEALEEALKLCKGNDAHRELAEQCTGTLELLELRAQT
jgi:predicted Zn-dependent protease